MNKITFHNRKRIVQEYSALFGCRRCIFCELQYQPGYTCSQNTLLIMDCNHLVHRQCLKIMLRGRLESNWNQMCNLCKVLEFFDRSEQTSKLIEITRSNSHRLGQFQIAKNVWGDVNDYFQLEESQYYEKFIHQVEKKGKYAYK